MNPEQIFNQNFKRNLGLSHREENTFDSRIYTQSEELDNKLGIAKLPGKSFRETIVGPVCFQTLPLNATIHSLPTRHSIVATDAIQQDWKHQFRYAFLPFSMIGRVLRKVKKDQINMIIVITAWQSQSWYPILLKMTIKNPCLLPKHPKVLLSPEEKIHTLIRNSYSLSLVAWPISGKVYLQKGCHKGLLTSSQMPKEQVLSQITNPPGESGLPGVIGKKTDPFSNHLKEVLDYLAEVFELGFEYSTLNTHRSAI